MKRSSLGGCLTLAAVAMLAACGGGGDNPVRQVNEVKAPTVPSVPPNDCAPASQPTASGTTPSVTAVGGGLLANDSGSHWMIFVAQSDGVFHGFYGEDMATMAAPSGQLYAGGSWWSSPDPHWYNGRDWPSGDAVCLEVTYDTRIPALSGSYRTRSGPGGSFSGGPIPGSSYSFEQVADAAQVAGPWALSSGSPIAVSNAGEFACSHDGCNCQGALAPASDGKNWFRLTLQLSGACSLVANHITSLEGFGVAYTIGDSQRLLLYATGNNGVDFGEFNAIAVRP